MEKKLSFNIRALLHFFDESWNKKHSEHSNFLVAMLGEELSTMLFISYMINEKKAKIKECDVPCKSEGRYGPWLDRWLINVEAKTRYQVEIKNWSSNSFNVPALDQQSMGEGLRKYCSERWAQLWNNVEGKFFDEKVDKVRASMDLGKLPEEYQQWSTPPVPLANFWFPVSADTRSRKSFRIEDHIFTTAIDCNKTEVCVFSCSLYLRHLIGNRGGGRGKNSVVVSESEMPKTFERLELINRVMKKIGAGWK